MIHQYILNGYHIILDVNSGSIHVTDPLAYEAIRLIDAGKTPEEAGRELLAGFADRGVTEQEVQESLADVEELRRSGKLLYDNTHMQGSP